MCSENVCFYKTKESLIFASLLFFFFLFRCPNRESNCPLFSGRPFSPFFFPFLNPMNPHSLQANPYSYNQNFTTDLTPELINSVSNQQNNIDNRIGSTNSPQPMFDPQSIATMMAKRQVYSGNSMLGMSSSSIENTSAMTSLHSPQNQNVSQQSLLLQQVRNSQAFQRMDEQQKLQYLMLQKQNIKEKDTAETKKSSFTLNDTELNSKRVEAVS